LLICGSVTEESLRHVSPWQVWASQYNERAFLSLRKAGLPHAQLCMAVLVQRVVPADYAFVIHTDNPSTGNKDEIYIEMVRGLGETLVGNYPGRALSCVVPKSNLAAPVIGSFPSKSVGLFVDETLIFRSDSNGTPTAIFGVTYSATFGATFGATYSATCSATYSATYSATHSSTHNSKYTG
jgi:hypothetical protein